MRRLLAMAALVVGLLAPRRAVATECEPQRESLFWPQLDALCLATNVPQTLQTYCAGGEAPRWAAAPEQERLGRVAKIAREADVDLSSVTAPAITAEVGRLLPPAPDGPLVTGAGVDVLLGELHGWLCAEDEVQPWLGATCASPLGTQALRALRTRVLRDLGLLPTRAIAELTPERGAEVARLLQAMAETLLGTARPLDLARALAPKRCPGGSSAPSERVAHLARLLVRIGADLPRAARLAPTHWERLLSTTLPDLGLPPLPDATRQRLASELADIAPVLRRLELETPSTPTRRLHAEALVGLLRLSWTAVGGPPLPRSLDAALAGLVEVDLSATLPALAATSLELAETPLPEVALERLDATVRVLSAPDLDTQQRIVRNALLGLGRWADGLLLDVNADTPILEEAGFRVGGDLLVGYNFGDVGFSVKGGLNYYEFIASEAFDDGYRAGGELAVWWSPRVSETAILEGRFEGQGYYYDSTTIAAGLDRLDLTDESSLMIRALLDLGARVDPSPTFAFGMWAGGGLQVELYDAVRLADTTAVVSSDTRLGGLFQGRLRAEWLAVPSWLAFRLRSDVTVHTITRDSLAITVAGGDVVPEERSRRNLQVEHYGRLFVDAEVARFAGFVPGLHAGLDTFFRDDAGGPVVANVPVFGVGVRQIAF